MVSRTWPCRSSVAVLVVAKVRFLSGVVPDARKLYLAHRWFVKCYPSAHERPLEVADGGPRLLHPDPAQAGRPVAAGAGRDDGGLQPVSEPAGARPAPALGAGAEVDRQRPQRLGRDPARPGRPARERRRGGRGRGHRVLGRVGHPHRPDPLRRPEGSPDQRLPGDGPGPPLGLTGTAAARSRARPAGRRSSRTAPRQHRATPSTALGITAGEPASTSRPITTGRTIPPSWPAENTMAVEVRDPGAATASQASTVGNTGPRASPVRA